MKQKERVAQSPSREGEKLSANQRLQPTINTSEVKTWNLVTRYMVLTAFGGGAARGTQFAQVTHGAGALLSGRDRLHHPLPPHAAQCENLSSAKVVSLSVPSLFNRFYYAEHSQLRLGSATEASLKRTGTCTRETARLHLDGLCAVRHSQ
jgi:hypothetical protein